MRQDEVYGQLAQVSDPELDQPLTELGFIGGVRVEGGTVTVHFRLPTFWCAANFAFLMSADIRERVSELPWVERVVVRLQDHFFDQEINDGVNGGKTFAETFPELATGNLEELRATFRAKAFLFRQECLLRSVLELGWSEEAILDVRVGDLPVILLYGQGKVLAERYLAILQERGLASDATAPAFVHPDGRPVAAAEFRAHLEHARRTRFSMEFNAAFCRGLLKTRYCETEEITAPDRSAGTRDKHPRLPE